jgi:hypothetical protein
MVAAPLRSALIFLPLLVVGPVQPLAPAAPAVLGRGVLSIVLGVRAIRARHPAALRLQEEVAALFGAKAAQPLSRALMGRLARHMAAVAQAPLI